METKGRKLIKLVTPSNSPAGSTARRSWKNRPRRDDVEHARRDPVPGQIRLQGQAFLGSQGFGRDDDPSRCSWLQHRWSSPLLGGRKDRSQAIDNGASLKPCSSPTRGSDGHPVSEPPDC